MPCNKKLREYLESKSWIEKRKEKLKENSLCEKCRRRKATEIHHKHYKSLGSESLNDLVSMCRICHLKTELEKALQKEKVICAETPFAEAEWLADRYKRLNPLEKPSFLKKEVMYVGSQWDIMDRSFLYDRFEKLACNHFCILWLDKNGKCDRCEKV